MNTIENTLQNITTKTPNGKFHIIVNEKDIALVSGFGNLDDLILRLPKELQKSTVKQAHNHQYEKYILSYYDGDSTALGKILYQQFGTEFQKKVWKALSTIPYGHTVSYKQLAQIAKYPTAIRAVGTACGMNRLTLLVPCHRVIREDGSIGNYFYGTKIKRYLLEQEGSLQ